MWVEARGRGRDALCLASDSRTLPGPIEGVTKVILFGRSDIAAVWAGDYRYAALLVSHLDAVFTASDAMRRRDIDLARAFARAVESIKRHLTLASEPAVPRHEMNPDAAQPERTTILASGYSLLESSYLVLRIQWMRDKQWRVGVTRVDPTRIVFIGDELHSANYVSKQARGYREPASDHDWHMEPLAAIHNACEDKRRPSIGGSLQMAKVYRHGNARAYGFLDPARSSQVLVRGTTLDQRASVELEAAGLLVDLSHWKLDSASFPGRRTEATRRKAAASR
jgi:hypothetical protein